MDVLKSPTESNLKNFSIDSILQNPFPVRLDPVQASAKVSFSAVGYFPDQRLPFSSTSTPAAAASAAASATHFNHVGMLNKYLFQNALRSMEVGNLPSFPVLQELPGASMNSRSEGSELDTRREAPTKKNRENGQKVRNPKKSSDTSDYSDEELENANATCVIDRGSNSPQGLAVEEYDGSSSPHNVERKGHFKKARTSFTQLQIQSLEIKFDQQKYLTRKDRTDLARVLRLTEKHVKTWFQNRRTKWKRECSEEHWSKCKEIAAAMMYSQYMEGKQA